MAAASPGNALVPSKSSSIPLLSADSVWHYADRRKQLDHLVKEPPCSCGAGPKSFSFIYEDITAKCDTSETLPDSLIPNEYKLVRHPGVLGLEPIEDKYSIRTKQHPNHMTVFPSLKPVSRKEVTLLRQTMDDMLRRCKREETSLHKTQLHQLVDVVQREQDVYNTVFHELIRQVSIHCLEQGQLLAKLREHYAALFSRVPRQIRGLHDELVAQRALDRRLATELSSFQTRVSSLTAELDHLKQHEVKVSEQALSARDELSQALTESEKNAGLLTEYHELYELQRRRLEGVTLKLSSEKELWQQTAYDLALKVADEFSLFTVRRLQLGEKTWNQLAIHFIVLLTQNDAQKLSEIEQLVSTWKEEFSKFSIELVGRERSVESSITETIREIESWRSFLREYLDTDGFRRYPEVEKMREMWEGVRRWEQRLSGQGDFFNGERLISLQDQLKQVKKLIESWTKISLRLFQFHPGRLSSEHGLMESTNQLYFRFHTNAGIRVSGENGVADGLIRITTPLETWSQKLSVMIGNLEKHTPDQNWVKFQVQLSDWLRELEELRGKVGRADASSESVEVSDVVKAVDKWLGSMMTSVDKENAGCREQVTSLHANLSQFTIQLLLKLTETLSSDLVPTAPKMSSSDIKIAFSDILQELTSMSEKVVANCSDLTAEISAKQKEAGLEDFDEEKNKLRSLQTGTSEWVDTAQKLIGELIAVDYDEMERPKLERVSKSIERKAESEKDVESASVCSENSSVEVKAICLDKNARSVGIEQLTEDTEKPEMISYLSETELPPSHALESVQTEEVVRELGESKRRVSELEKKITELEIELKSKESVEKEALEKVADLELMLERSKQKSPSKQGRQTPKRGGSSTSQVRTSVTPSHSSK